MLSNKMKKMISVLFILLSVCFLLSTINYPNFYWNIVHKTYLETQNFIINVPLLYWGMHTNDNGTELYFAGNLVEVKDINEKIIPTVDLYSFNDDYLNNLEKFCNRTFKQIDITINNVEFEAYSCQSSSDYLVVNHYLIYKNEVFVIYNYTHDINAFNAFQSQYDKFFQGVKLKE